MLLQDFFTKLSHGELSNLMVGSEGAGTIEPGQHDKVVTHINAVLSILYARFSHKVNYVKVALQDGLRVYNLDSQFAVSNIEPLNLNPRYILDSADQPFTDDVIKVSGIFIEDDPSTIEIETQTVTLNVNPSFSGLRMLSFKSFMIPDPKAGVILNVEYRANHPKLSLPADTSEEIVLIPALMEALEYGVAARIYRAMNGEVNMAKANGLEGAFERVCALVENKDLLAESENFVFDKVADRGFV